MENNTNNNSLNDFVSSNNNKKSNKALNRLTNRLNKTKKRAQNTIKKVTSKTKNSVSSGTQGIDFSLLDVAKMFGGILVFPTFADINPKKECDGETGYQTRYDELLEESLKQADEMKNDFKDVGSYLTISPSEESIFLKKQIKVDCIPVEPNIEPNSKEKDEDCWSTVECKTGLKCNNTDKYIKGVCEDGGKEKIEVEEGGDCAKTMECKDNLECKGSYVKKVFGKGTCTDTGSNNNKNNKISNKSGFVGNN